jgi:hypothetical protein
MRYSKKAHPVQYISYNTQLRSHLYRDMHKVGAEIDKIVHVKLKNMSCTAEIVKFKLQKAKWRTCKIKAWRTFRIYASLDGIDS